MFTCIISIDILNDDYILRFNVSFDNKKSCDDIIKIINNKNYKSEYSKKNVHAHLSTENMYFDNSTFFRSTKDAIIFLENFFKEFCVNNELNKQLEKNYKVYETKFSNVFQEKINNFYHSDSDFNDEYL
jgi:hypothetical protein